MHTDPEATRRQFDKIAAVITRFVHFVQAKTGTSSISVNRNVRHLKKPVMLHSECSHTMISAQDYETFLLRYDVAWSQMFDSFGIHYCGPDPQRHAGVYEKIPRLRFVDVGAGGDVALLRRHLPDAFLNLRLDPVTFGRKTPDEIHNAVVDMVDASGRPGLTGVCCINMDYTVSDSCISALFETVRDLHLRDANP